ncbi:hypothetical protein [Microbacterium sp.]|uniref:hypothetical protein n=1 Tax=Microbacterium sp. TaxID=51671 RepID=UPI0028124A6A|nr:hypothetical protein [Microbacterium sp.]
MSQPETAKAEKKNTSLLIRGAIWIAIGALIAAAIVCVIWVLVGDQDGLIARAFLTILLLAAFAGIAILEAGLAPNRPDWLALASMVSWIVALLVGAVKIWLPDDEDYFGGAERFFQLLLVVGILQLALLHVRLYTPAAKRHVTTFTRVIYIVTLVFLVALVAMLVFFLTFPHTFDYVELYWRIVVALTILAAVGTTLVPLLNALFAPKKRPVAAAGAPTGAPSWPTYADGFTPLPVLADGQPDWNAYYTGYPTAPQQQSLPAAPAPQFPTVPAAPVAAAPAAVPPAPEAPVSAEPPAPAAPDAPPVPPAPPAPAAGDHTAFPPPPPAAPSAQQ